MAVDYFAVKTLTEADFNENRLRLPVGFYRTLMRRNLTADEHARMGRERESLILPISNAQWLEDGASKMIVETRLKKGVIEREWKDWKNLGRIRNYVAGDTLQFRMSKHMAIGPYVTITHIPAAGGGGGPAAGAVGGGAAGVVGGGAAGAVGGGAAGAGGGGAAGAVGGGAAGAVGGGAAARGFGYQGPLPFTLHTGYVGVGESEEIQLFYYFVEWERSDVSVHPLILWLTGGPGCSAFSSLVFETGPLAFDYHSQSLPMLKPNPYSWTKVASIIFLDSPLGTGFSYSTTHQGYYSNDTLQSAHIYQFLTKWLLNHPNFRATPLYISGDSYAGQIVPIVVQQILTGTVGG